jgi:hypothetical protein
LANDNNSDNLYVGLTINNYKVTERIGKGRRGIVYKAERADPKHVVACKIIPERKLTEKWDNELKKVIELVDVPGVVQYLSHGRDKDHLGNYFVWIFWNYIPGENLRQYIRKHETPIEIPFIESLTKSILGVLIACQAVGITHGDLHEGNILVREPDKRLANKPRTIWVTDFGSKGSDDSIAEKDDFRQLFSIIVRLLEKIKISDLNPRDRLMYRNLIEFSRKVLELDATQGPYVNNPENLLEELHKISKEADDLVLDDQGRSEWKGPGDYLWAEALGFRIEEWKELFVPEFLAAKELLSTNITVLTGARGCGKTMAFRRMTAFMDKKIGGPSGVPGSERFIGYYLNCRDLVEAFPWHPSELNEGAKQQILHFFHTAWLIDICKTLVAYKSEDSDYIWVDKLFKQLFKEKYEELPQGSDPLNHALSFLENEKERCRVSRIGKQEGLHNWQLARFDVLDTCQEYIEKNVSWIRDKPLFFFLDDYTTPYVPTDIQLILNPIIFKRRDKMFFKVSTESINSFERVGLNNKPLEERNDFELIDLANESLHYDDDLKLDLLDSIFKRRMDRHPSFKGTGKNLIDLIGHLSISNNELAWALRNAVQGNGLVTVRYQGVESFVGMWSSDTRALIQTFVMLLREAEKDITTGSLPIKPEIQDRVYRAVGGNLVLSIAGVLDPAFLDKGPIKTSGGQTYGKHLKDIVETFIEISRFEMTKGNLVSNQGYDNPKQAFRIEIMDDLKLPIDIDRYFEGMIRWHIFLQDSRGKSMRGTLGTRLYLNRTVIPFAKLTFSRHDCISMTNEEFVLLLSNPRKFKEYWMKKRGTVTGESITDPKWLALEKNGED